MVGEKANDRDGDAVAGDVIGFVVIVRQHVLFGNPMRRAASRGESRRDRTFFPSTIMIVWRLEPPAGVRKQPATSSKRISAR